MKSSRLQLGWLHCDEYIHVCQSQSMMPWLSLCVQFVTRGCICFHPPRYVPVGLACLAQYILLRGNEIRAYLWRAPAFLVPKRISACTNALGAANWEVPPENVCRMLLASVRSSLETSVTFYFQKKVFSPDLRRISGCRMWFLKHLIANCCVI